MCHGAPLLISQRGALKTSRSPSRRCSLPSRTSARYDITNDRSSSLTSLG
ncbi:transposase IS4 family domain protein [Burkholderia pseudomallei ABCPW 107]|nr:transposase IS4 family domain protein [Burkholderia pseudomallei ABCPW 107]